ncbi:DUF2752 domain-containing protein [Geothrix sp. PMB-07]|uniref:DUF2752 domain-containing protein n=1 Tax=Geothrix sp. PMB-07 TaxID=3068640 RepID=UPI002741B198|nr:DUF2752 domain-containing protein [Geothrix sp. PMB-07]WLT31551.1 DUF2752 domain-containing protein [Geothrix sp. PMB-07]
MRRVPWVALGTLGGWAALWLGTRLLPLFPAWPECPFKRLTGFACATCGFTRCALALGHGNWKEAFHWHPAAALMAIVLPLVSVWDLRRAWRKEPYPRLPDSWVSRLSIWALLLGIWALQVARGI